MSGLFAPIFESYQVIPLLSFSLKSDQRVTARSISHRDERICRTHRLVDQNTHKPPSMYLSRAHCITPKRLSLFGPYFVLNPACHLFAFESMSHIGKAPGITH